MVVFGSFCVPQNKHPLGSLWCSSLRNHSQPSLLPFCSWCVFHCPTLLHPHPTAVWCILAQPPFFLHAIHQLQGNMSARKIKQTGVFQTTISAAPHGSIWNSYNSSPQPVFFSKKMRPDKQRTSIVLL